MERRPNQVEEFANSPFCVNKDGSVARRRIPSTRPQTPNSPYSRPTLQGIFSSAEPRLCSPDGRQRIKVHQREFPEQNTANRKKIRRETDNSPASQGYYPRAPASHQPFETDGAEAAVCGEEPDENSYMRRVPAQSQGSVNETVRLPGVDHPVHHTVQVGANGNRHDQLQVKIVSGDGKTTETISVDHVTGPGVDKIIATTTETSCVDRLQAQPCIPYSTTQSQGPAPRAQARGPRSPSPSPAKLRHVADYQPCFVPDLQRGTISETNRIMREDRNRIAPRSRHDYMEIDDLERKTPMNYAHPQDVREGLWGLGARVPFSPGPHVDEDGRQRVRTPVPRASPCASPPWSPRRHYDFNQIDDLEPQTPLNYRHPQHVRETLWGLGPPTAHSP